MCSSLLLLLKTKGEDGFPFTVSLSRLVKGCCDSCWLTAPHHPLECDSQVSLPLTGPSTATAAESGLYLNADWPLPYSERGKGAPRALCLPPLIRFELGDCIADIDGISNKHTTSTGREGGGVTDIHPGM